MRRSERAVAVTPVVAALTGPWLPTTLAAGGAFARWIGITLLCVGLLPPVAAQPAPPASAPPAAASVPAKPKIPPCDKAQYPVESARRGEQGSTKIRFTVNQDGAVIDANVVSSSGFAALDEEALRVLLSCRLMPAPLKDGQSQLEYTTVVFVWKLD